MLMLMFVVMASMPVIVFSFQKLYQDHNDESKNNKGDLNGEIKPR